MVAIGRGGGEMQLERCTGDFLNTVNVLFLNLGGEYGDVYYCHVFISYVS